MLRAIPARSLLRFAAPARGWPSKQRPDFNPFRTPSQVRSIGKGKARLITKDPEDPKAEASATTIDIIYGAPDEAYIYIRPDVSQAFQDAVHTRQADDQYTLPLLFNHTLKRFNLGQPASPYPQIEISHQLPRQSADQEVSAATLDIEGLWHAITIDGSFEALLEGAAGRANRITCNTTED